jgi:hypothetical protein
MPGVFFTSDPSQYTALEGVYVTEQNPPGAVQGVQLNTVGIAGACVRGPVDTPIEITSFGRFLEVFGARDYTADGTGGAIIGEVWKFFLSNPLGKVIAVRAAAAAAVKASFTLEDAAGGAGVQIVRVDASSPGAWGGNTTAGAATGVKLKVEAATDGTSGKFNLRVKYLGQVKLYENLDLRVGTDNSLLVLGDDPGNVITLTKLADGTPLTAGMAGLDVDGYITLGQTVASFVAVLGADGAIADTDYTATNRAIDQLAAYSGIAVMLVAERAGATINGALKTKAAVATDRMYLIWNGTHATAKAAVVSDAVNYRDTEGRLVYCFNSPYKTDSQTGASIQVPPHHQMAACFSQTAVDQHVGSNRTKAVNAGVTKLTFETLTRDDYKDLKAAGVSALERHATGGFVFVSGVTTCLTSGKQEIARRRQTDFLQLSIAARLVDYVKEPNTEDLRSDMGGEVVSFLDGFKRSQRIVASFAVDQGATVNNDTQRAAGLEFIQTRVRLIGHALGIVLKTQIGTGVTIAQDAA